MKQYNILQAFYMSFYSQKLYRDVAQNWGGSVVLYLFVLLAISWGIMMIQIQPTLKLMFAQMGSRYYQQFPEIVIKEGVVNTPENKPYIIIDPDTQKPFAVIDTSGKYQDFTTVPSDTVVLVRKDAVIYQYKKEVKTQKIPNDLNMTLKPDHVKTTLISIGSWLWILILPITLLASFIYRLVQSLVYAVIGEIFAALSNIKINYSEMLKMTMITLTPVIVLDTILDFLHISFPLQWLMYFGISMAYLIFALRANKNVN